MLDMYKAEVYVSIKNDILDPQGKTVNHAMESLGFSQLKNTRIGKYITFEVNETSEEKAGQVVDEICKKLLINPNIEKYTFKINKG
jgi:phosphoribosylformylglycinamidine synthase